MAKYKRTYKTKYGQRQAAVAQRKGDAATLGALTAAATGLTALGAYSVGNVALGRSLGDLTGAMNRSVGKLRAQQRLANAKAFAAERFSKKRQLSSAPSSATGKQQKATRVGLALVKGHYSQGHFVKQHMRRIG